MGKKVRKPRGKIENKPQLKAVMKTFKPEDKTRVLVAVLSLDGNVNWTIAHEFGRMMANSPDPRCPYNFSTHVKTGVRPVEYARNLVTELFMHEGEWEILLMIDHDQLMPQNWHGLFTVGGADIVSGLTYCWVGNQFAAGRLRVNQYGVDDKMECFNIQPPPTNGKPYEAPIVGTGCIAIRRNVFEKLGCGREDCDQHNDAKRPDPWYFTQKPLGRYRGSEDINFCVDARRNGFKIAVHPGVVFGHMKSVELSQIAEMIGAQSKMKAEGKTPTIEQMKSLG